MSVYSGFTTRSLETKYNSYLAKLLHLCQSSLLALIKKGYIYVENISIFKLSFAFMELFNQLKILENQKYLHPKFTSYCTDLASHLNNDTTHILHEKSHCSIKKFDYRLLNTLDYDKPHDYYEVSSQTFISNRPQKTRQSSSSNRVLRKNIFKVNKLLQPRKSIANSAKSTPLSKSSKRLDPRMRYYDKIPSVFYSDLSI